MQCLHLKAREKWLGHHELVDDMHQAIQGRDVPLGSILVGIVQFRKHHQRGANQPRPRDDDPRSITVQPLGDRKAHSRQGRRAQARNAGDALGGQVFREMRAIDQVEQQNKQLTLSI